MTGFMMLNYREFTGAYRHYDDDGKEYYEPRGPITVQIKSVDAFYDHTLLIGGKGIRVMETYEEIMKKMA